MDRPYESIPRQGRHPGSLPEEPSNSVRAQPAPYPPESEPEKPAAPTFGLYYNEAEGIYRIHSWHEQTPGAFESDYTEVGIYDRLDRVTGAIPEQARFVVFENPETGEAYYDKQGNVTNWMPGERFVQVTLFQDENAAAAYADARRRK